MELTYFESGFEKMKDDIANNSLLLFDMTASFLNTIAQDYGWNGEKDEALKVIDWCEGIVKAYASMKDAISMDHYLRIRRSLAFFRLVAVKRSCDSDGAIKLYNEFKEAVNKIFTTINLNRNDLELSTFNSQIELIKDAGEVSALQKERSAIVRKMQDLTVEIAQNENNLG